jgi:hypothetical protein
MVDEDAEVLLAQQLALRKTVEEKIDRHASPHDSRVPPASRTVSGVERQGPAVASGTDPWVRVYSGDMGNPRGLLDLRESHGDAIFLHQIVV